MAGFKALLGRNKLMDTLFHLKGNAKACIYTQPLWGLPFNLYIPLAAKYMEALGLDAFQIGVVATTYLLSQMFFSLISGAVTDKLGRRFTAHFFDLFSWALPLLLWMNAQSFGWFLAAAALNGVMRLTDNAWSLLLVEDTPQGLLVPVYALTTIAGLLSGFAAPLTSLFVTDGNLVPTMRLLYLIAFVAMLLKIILQYTFTRETAMGQQRKDELKNLPLPRAMSGSFSVFRQMLHNKPLMLLLCVLSCVMMIRGNTQNFWPLLVTGKLGVGEGALPLLAALKSLVQLACFFVIAPRLNPRYFFRPLRFGLGAILALHLFWYALPRQAAALVYAGVFIEALEMSILVPLFSSLLMLLMDKAERSKMYGLSMAFCLLVTAPFGTLNGMLYKLDATAPMLLSALLAGLALLLSHRLNSLLEQQGRLARIQEETA